MGIKLFKHNEIGFERLVRKLKKSQFAAINHATGTGKSFITLKYLHEYYKGKKVLYLSPTYPIFNQLTKDHMKTLGIDINEFEKFDNVIYRNLLGRDMEALVKEYDIIIFDEYHRCGAKKSGKKIKEIKKIIKQKYIDKKIIGLTATPKRYLDKERDMTNELFDGECASTLELADAIIQGILPAPVYVILLNYLGAIDKLEDKIEKEVFYDVDKKKLLDNLKSIEKIVKQLNDGVNVFEPFIKDNKGKYIAFNSTIENIKKNNEKIKGWFGNRKINFYEVHSHQSREENERILEEFKHADNGINVLCVVDILNEGIHVDGIDGILMMRKTTSPIIYFQQLGRLLSYSGRKDELVVWDLVGNINNHKVIYELYQDVRQRAKKLIKEDPENKERYETILKRFKIIDNTTIISERLSDLTESLSKENVIKQRLTTAINILSGKIKVDDFNQKVQAHIDLYTYQNFVNIDMYKEISKLDIMKPDELSVSFKEFQQRLNGCDCLHDKNIADNELMVKTLNDYYKTNGKIPSVLSSDKEEQALAMKIVERSYGFSGKLRTEMNDIIKKDKKISAYDLVYYGASIPYVRYKEFLEELDNNINNPNIISRYLITFLNQHKSSTKYDFSYYFYRIKEYSHLNYKTKVTTKKSVSDRIIEFGRENNGKLPSYNLENEDEMKLFLEFNSKSTSFKNKYVRILQSSMYEIHGIEDEEEIKKVVESVSNKLLEFINKNHRYPVAGEKEHKQYNGYKKLLIKYGYKEKLDELLKLRKDEDIKKEIDILIPMLICFIKENYGDLPSSKVDDMEEQELAKKYGKLKKYFSNEQISIISNIIYEIKNNSDNFIDVYVDFIMKNKRYPLSDSDDPNERNLQNRYKRCVDSLDANELKRIKRALAKINEKKTLKNTFAEMYKKGRIK